MGSRRGLLFLISTVFFLLLTTKANPVPFNPSPASIAPLPAPGTIQNAVNVNEFLTVPLPSRILQRPNGGPQYSIRYSVNAIRSTSNGILMSIALPANDLRAALQAAIDNGAKHSPSEMQTSFVSSANSLSVIINSYEAKSNRPPFNWQDVSSVAAVLLKASPGGASDVNSFVGVVVNPEGNSIVDFAVIPTFVHIHSKGSRSLIPVRPSTNNPRHNLDTLRRLQKRVSYHIDGTGFSLEYDTGPHDVNGFVLRMLIIYALDMLLLDTPSRAYTTVVSSPLGPVIARDGHVVFSLRAMNSQRISRLDILTIMSAIRDVVSTYVQRNRYPGLPYKSLVGQVLNNAGVAIAHWSVGELLGSVDECGMVLVTQPDGSHGLGCLA